MSVQNEKYPVNLRTAAQMGTILRGAAMGGPYGAAAGAVNAFLPAILKGIFYSLTGLLLLAFTIFYSLPGSMYGFAGVENVDVQARSAQAAGARELYAQFAGYTEEAAELLAEGIDSSGYDAVSVTMELDALGPEWTAAVCSVLYRQELGEIREETLRELAAEYLTYETEVEIWEEEIELPQEADPAEQTEQKERLLIFIRGTGAEGFMERLGFTEEQKQWARFIHDQLTQSQLSAFDVTDSVLEDFESLTLTEGGRDVVYYNQRDSRWAYHPYGGYSLIETGCGPTSLAMVVSTLTEEEVTPPEMADWAYRHGYCMPEGGSYHNLIPEGARCFGLKAEGLGRDGQAAADALAEGKLVVAIMGPGTFTTTGHYLVLRGVTAEGKVLVADSYSYTYSRREWDFSLILREARSYAAAGGPFWAISEA